MGPVGTVFEDDAGARDRIADAVGGRPVLVRARGGALRDEFMHEHVKCVRLWTAVRGILPLRVGGVQAQDPSHPADLDERTEALVARIAAMPLNQLIMVKLALNTQLLANEAYFERMMMPIV